MKPKVKWVVLGYCLAVCLLLGLESKQFRRLDQLRDQIFESYELIAGRDEGIRLELEYRRFMGQLQRFAHIDERLMLDKVNGLNSTTSTTGAKAEMLRWFDILWSRAHAIRVAEVAVLPEQSSGLSSLVEDLKRSLQVIDPLVHELHEDDTATYMIIRQEMEPFGKPISAFAASISTNRFMKAMALRGQLYSALGAMGSMLVISVISFLIILILIFTDLIRARKEEYKTRKREAQVRFLAEHDSLTGLRNRAFLNRKLGQFIEKSKGDSTGFHLMLLDLDKFKDVNDTYGHPTGDQLLKMVSSRLMKIFGASKDIVVRLGGDEFAILTEADGPATEKAAEAVIESLSSSFDIAGREICISTSVGISRYPDLSSSADDLMRDADLALYAAKNKERGTFAVFERAMSEQTQQRVTLEADLRRALRSDGGGLEVYYQPQVRLGSEEQGHVITGVEALVRWNHAERGSIPPLSFISIAETSGLIHELTDWIVRQAFIDVASWHRAGFKLNLSVNLSPHQLNDSRLPEDLLSHLDQCGFDPHYLTLEITESTDVNDMAVATKILSSLADHGISLAMDDFGTGYSNLGYLKNLPLHTLKIDRAFVMHIEDREEDRKLVRGIIRLAKGMGLTVVAEGVETEAQMAFLRAEKCDIGQGYLFGRPTHKLGIVAMLSEQSQAGTGAWQELPEDNRLLA